MTLHISVLALLLAGLAPPSSLSAETRDALILRAASVNGARSEEVFRRTRRMLHAWLAYADARTLLLPDVLPGFKRGPRGLGIYRPHNSGADNYPYLVATSFFTDRPLMPPGLVFQPIEQMSPWSARIGQSFSSPRRSSPRG